MLYEGFSASALQARLELPEVHVHARVTSTMDEANALAARGAPAGTLVIAEQQDAGRGRNGRTWHSPPGAGIWMTLVERPTDPAAVGVLSLRVGLAMAQALDHFVPAPPVRIKWPNDLYRGDGKLAGILVEARWREQAVDWVAIGIGINLRTPPNVASTAALPQGTDRIAVLTRVVPAVHQAAAAAGVLTPDELAAYRQRDWAFDRPCSEPIRGTVRGISADGALLIENVAGAIQAFRSASLQVGDRPA